MKDLLEDFKAGKISLEELLGKLKALSYEDIGFAKIDTQREIRKGFPEIIYCQGKTISQIKKIIETMLKHEQTILATKANKEIYNAVRGENKDAKYYDLARIIVIQKQKMRKKEGKILVLTGGTADIPIAEEVAVTAEIMGNIVEKAYDVGVAGIHRLLDIKDKLFEANVIVVVAGMDGALVSVVGGLSSKPIIAVPTSVGYGASFEGIAPLLTMLNCCAFGVTVVNIDNGVGAGYFANLINR
jgi:NCAIR mutase (PurE)-related protein